jgi:hypothetical protein
MNRRLVVLALLIVLSVAQAGGSGAAPSACGSSPTMNLADVQKRLTAAEALWKRRGPAAYRMNIDLEGEFGISRFQLSVPLKDSAWLFVYPQFRNGEANIRSSAPWPTPVDTYTVPGLFAEANSVLGLAQEPGTCGVLNITFDHYDGHVRVLRFDNFAVTDEEFTLTVSPLLPLP